jgi:hypothetical protein
MKADAGYARPAGGGHHEQCLSGDRAAIITPKLDQNGVQGMLRDWLFAHAPQLGYQLTEAEILPAQLQAADAVFLSNSLIGLWPVASIDGQPLPQASLLRPVASAAGTAGRLTGLILLLSGLICCGLHPAKAPCACGCGFYPFCLDILHKVC